ncbi:ImuA family protein [Caulobacter mirabilis]|uniref:Protein imuA n=1 Tax=Caulobacter mirabilis TaxID=69666 RepID=A0A2D2B3L0_9CAUL|nr:protein imuA [Caulobacter mirabilis]ATQ44852.1 protein imuA [Caulobacter mirabilis]
MPGSRQARLTALKGQVAALEAGTRTPTSVLPFGDPRVDDCLPGGGLPLGRWHELASAGMEIETGAVAAGFAAMLARSMAGQGAVIWVMRRDDLYAPGLAGLGLSASRLIQVKTPDEVQTLMALEDALGSAGVAAVIGEVEDVDLTAGRRLQLACERHGATGLVIRRRPWGGTGRKPDTGSAAATRWRVSAAPSDPVGEPGLGPPRWRAALERSRGGRPGEWIFEGRQEADHDAHPLRVVSGLADHGLDAANDLPVRRRA